MLQSVAVCVCTKAFASLKGELLFLKAKKFKIDSPWASWIVVGTRLEGGRGIGGINQLDIPPIPS